MGSTSIMRPEFWVDVEGKNPSPFTKITLEDVKSGRWKPSEPTQLSVAMSYLEILNKSITLRGSLDAMNPTVTVYEQGKTD